MEPKNRAGPHGVDSKVSLKRLARRAKATQDLEIAFDYYFQAVNFGLAERFKDEFDDAMAHISHYPGTESCRYSAGLTGGDLWFWTLDKFLYSIFYFEREDHIEIIRVLHQSSNIPARLET